MRRDAVSLAMLAAVAVVGRAGALELELWDGQVRGSFDTTLTAGMLLRVAERDADLIGIINGGTADSNNTDDGDLNYDQWHPVSSQMRATHELSLRWRNFAVFGRAFYFYDPVIQSVATERTPLGDLANAQPVIILSPDR